MGFEPKMMFSKDSSQGGNNSKARENTKEIDWSELNVDGRIKQLLVEGKAQKYTFEVGGKTGEEYKKELLEKNIVPIKTADELLEKMSPSKNRESSYFIRLSLKGLGLEEGATTEQIYKRAKELGLELCQAEAGPEFRLAYSGKQFILVGMEQIIDSSGDPCIFGIGLSGDGLKLYGSSAKPGKEWDSGYQWLFSLKKKAEELI